MINQTCAICEKSNFEIKYKENFDLKNVDAKTFSARRLPDRVHFQIVRCNNCGLLYSTPILPYKKIENLYKKSFTSYTEHTQNLSASYGYYLRQLDKLGVKKGRLLEIGCGNGFFLEEALRQGYKSVYGVEPGEKSVMGARESIKKNITIDIFRKNLCKKDFFDVLICFQTFDHIPDPNSFLSECYRILKKGGLVLFLNHDEQALLNRLLGQSSPIIDIEHMYLFNKGTMRRIFKKHRFKVLKVDSAFNIHALGYWLRLVPLPVGFKKSLLKILESSNLANLKIKIYPGNLVLYAKK